MSRAPSGVPRAAFPGSFPALRIAVPCSPGRCARPAAGCRAGKPWEGSGGCSHEGRAGAAPCGAAGRAGRPRGGSSRRELAEQVGPRCRSGLSESGRLEIGQTFLAPKIGLARDVSPRSSFSGETAVGNNNFLWHRHVEEVFKTLNSGPQNEVL